MDINLYNQEQFKETFLNFDFDNILIQHNNSLINSNESYLQYKKEYLNNTQDNLEKYTKLYNSFKNLYNNYVINNNKYSYTFVDKNEYNKINKDLKGVLIEQRQLYNNFMTYIQLLNSH
jgi:hypothetical protein